MTSDNTAEAVATIGEVVASPPLDLIWGARAIAAVINKPVKATYHLLEQRAIPARRIGKQWVISRQRLRDHFDVTEGELDGAAHR